MTHTAEIESDAHGVHHHEKEAFDSFCSEITACGFRLIIRFYYMVKLRLDKMKSLRGVVSRAVN
jgi:hypothetical protein